MVTARDKATDTTTTRLNIDGKEHIIPNKELYSRVAGYHQSQLKNYGVDVDIPKEKPKETPKKKSTKPPPALAEHVNMRESIALMRKAHTSNIDYDVILEVYVRGLNEWESPNHLTREQYAFNRVNSFVAGGKATKLDEDLKKETQ